MKSTMTRQTRAFLEHLGIIQPDRELPEPITAEWTRRKELTGHTMFEAGTINPFVHYDVLPVFDGEEVYFSDQLNGDDFCDLTDMGDVEFIYNNPLGTVTVRRRGVTIDKLPHYVNVDIVTGARGPGRFRYHNGK